MKKFGKLILHECVSETPLLSEEEQYFMYGGDDSDTDDSGDDGSDDSDEYDASDEEESEEEEEKEKYCIDNSYTNQGRDSGYWNNNELGDGTSKNTTLHSEDETDTIPDEDRLLNVDELLSNVAEDIVVIDWGNGTSNEGGYESNSSGDGSSNSSDTSYGGGSSGYGSYYDYASINHSGDDYEDNEEEDALSKNKVILLGGADFSNAGEYGTNKEIAQIVAVSAGQKGIKLNKGDVTIFNSPLFVNDFKTDIVNPLIVAITKNFDKNHGKVILYGYSLGGNILMYCLEELQRQNININLLITIDAAKGYPGLVAVETDVPDNVKLNLNIFQTNFSDIGSRGFPNNGSHVINIDLSNKITAKNEQVNHGNIDEYTMLFISQAILYCLEGNNALENMTKDDIIRKIALYDKQR